MYICLCEPVTDRDIKTAVMTGCRSVRDLAGTLGCCRDCGKCVRAAKEVIDAARADLRAIQFHVPATAHGRENVPALEGSRPHAQRLTVKCA
jgi:bacterioferritin-associated ferredoxin